MVFTSSHLREAFPGHYTDEERGYDNNHVFQFHTQLERFTIPNVVLDGVNI